MSTFVPKKQHFREVILHYFLAKKSSAETHRLLVDVYGVHAPVITTCQNWFLRFRNGDFSIDDKKHERAYTTFEDGKLEECLETDPCQTVRELSATLDVHYSTISRRLSSLGYVQRQGIWVPHELSARDRERRKTMCEILLERHKRKGFLYRIVTSDEKWIHYDNPKRKPAWVRPGEVVPSTSKRNIHGMKKMLCIWWDMKGVIYYEILKPNETITADLYRRQLIRLCRALDENRPEYETRHSEIILLHDNARPHVAQPVKSFLEGMRWEVLPHPPYSPDIAPSDYHLFRSMQSALTEQKFNKVQDIEKWVDRWIASKDPEFFSRGIHLLPERWAKVIAADGSYFE